MCRSSSTNWYYTPLAAEAIHPSTLKWMISRVSEQVVYRPLEALQHFYFTYANGLLVAPQLCSAPVQPFEAIDHPE